MENEKSKQKAAHSKAIQIPCPDCNTVLNSKAAFNYHTTNKVCSKNNGKYNTDTNSQIQYMCPDCDVKLKSEKALRYHIVQGVCKKGKRKLNMTTKGNNDENGDEETNNESVVKRKDNQPKKQQTPSHKVKKVCERCNKVLNSAAALKYHLQKNVCQKPDKTKRSMEDNSTNPRKKTKSNLSSNSKVSKLDDELVYMPIPNQSTISLNDLKIKFNSPSAYHANADKLWKQETKTLKKNNETLIDLKLFTGEQIDAKLDSSIFLANSFNVALNVGNDVWAMDLHNGFTEPHDNGTFLAVGTYLQTNAVHIKGKPYSGDNYIQIWNISKSSPPTLLLVIKHNGEAAFQLKWHPKRIEGTVNNVIGFLACALGNGEVHVLAIPFNGTSNGQQNCYEINDLSLFCSTLSDRGSLASSIEWNPVNNCLAAGLDDGTIALWDFGSMTTLVPNTNKLDVSHQNLLPHSKLMAYHMLNERAAASCHGVITIAWCPDSPHLIVCVNADNGIYVWDIRKPCEPILSKPMRNIMGAQLSTIHWGRNSDILLVGDENGKVHAIQFIDGTNRTMAFHDAFVHCIVSNHDYVPNLAASASADGKTFVHTIREKLTFLPNKSGALVNRPGVSLLSHKAKLKTSKNGNTVAMDALTTVNEGYNIEPGTELAGGLWLTSSTTVLEKVKKETNAMHTVCWGRTNEAKSTYLAWGGEAGIVRVSLLALH